MACVLCVCLGGMQPIILVDYCCYARIEVKVVHETPIYMYLLFYLFVCPNKIHESHSILMNISVRVFLSHRDNERGVVTRRAQVVHEPGTWQTRWQCTVLDQYLLRAEQLYYVVCGRRQRGRPLLLLGTTTNNAATTTAATIEPGCGQRLGSLLSWCIGSCHCCCHSRR